MRSSSSGPNVGNGWMFGPRRISTAAPSAGGCTNHSGFHAKRFGHGTTGLFPRVRGSVMRPRSAEAAAVSGEHR